MTIIVNRPKAVSLFTGAGGLDIGFFKTGFEIVACIEIKKEFCHTLEINKSKYFEPQCQVINKDIRDVSLSDLRINSCDFIIGGPPCQSFSAAGRRAGGVMGINDNRGSLFEHYCRFIKHLKPRGFLFENVRGILSANKRQDWTDILAAFSELGYQVAYRVLDAADYGVPQHRERLILVGIEKGRQFLFPSPLYGPDSQDGRPYISCREAIADLQDTNEPEHQYGGKYGDLLNQVPPGQNYHFFTRELGYPDPIFAWRSRFSDFLYKAHPEQPVRTIVARPGAYSGPFHWKNRRFTVAEFKRLFSYPDDYNISGGVNTALQQIGNSVAPAFAEQLAKAVQKQVFNSDIDVKLLNSEGKLSFDHRKSKKAKQTRILRLSNDVDTLPLFSYSNNASVHVVELAKQYYSYYSTWRKVTRSKITDTSLGDSYLEIKEVKQDSDVLIKVTRFGTSKSCNKLMLEYCLYFHHTIGDGFKKIKCQVYSNLDQDIVAAWDAIEYYLNEHSNYISMMDVYGHFTEPHPIFDLSMEVLYKKSSFLLKFAKYFSDFSKNYIDCPASLLSSFHKKKEKFVFIDDIKFLRSLRFDIRVFETNQTIKQGFFRCCYPFTIHLDKQASVTWKENENGNREDVMISNRVELLLSEIDTLISDNAAITASQTNLSAIATTQCENAKIMPPTIFDCINTIVENKSANKYLFSIILTCCIKKILDPSQDVRIAQDNMTNGYSNRSLDQRYVTPFLKHHAYTHCEASGLESGRNFERPLPWNLEYPAKPRGDGNREAFLGILNYIEEQNGDPKDVALCLLYSDKSSHIQSEKTIVPPRESQISIDRQQKQ